MASHLYEYVYEKSYDQNEKNTANKNNIDKAYAPCAREDAGSIHHFLQIFYCNLSDHKQRASHLYEYVYGYLDEIFLYSFFRILR